MNIYPPASAPTDRNRPVYPLLSLIDQLEALGVTVPSAQEYRALRAAQVPGPPTPGRLLDLTPSELGELALSWGTYIITNGSPEQQHAARALDALLHDLDEEQRATIRANADSIIDQLRPTFDGHAEAGRTLRGMGVDPEASFETLFTAPTEVRTLWLAFRDRHAPALEHLLAVRQSLTLVAGVAPTLPDGLYSDDDRAASIDWGITVTNGRTLAPLADKAPHMRWLELAPDLQLGRPTELDDLDALHAQTGWDVDRFVAEATRRAAMEGVTPNTTDHNEAEAAR